MASVSSAPRPASPDACSDADDSNGSVFFGDLSSPYKRADARMQRKFFGATPTQDPLRRRDTILLRAALANVEGPQDDDADTTAESLASVGNESTLSRPNSPAQDKENTAHHDSLQLLPPGLCSPSKLASSSPNNKQLLRSPLASLAMPASPLRFYAGAPHASPLFAVPQLDSVSRLPRPEALSRTAGEESIDEMSDAELKEAEDTNSKSDESEEGERTIVLPTILAAAYDDIKTVEEVEDDGDRADGEISDQSCDESVLLNHDSQSVEDSTLDQSASLEEAVEEEDTLAEDSPSEAEDEDLGSELAGLDDGQLDSEHVEEPELSQMMEVVGPEDGGAAGSPVDMSVVIDPEEDGQVSDSPPVSALEARLLSSPPLSPVQTKLGVPTPVECVLDIDDASETASQASVLQSPSTPGPAVVSLAAVDGATPAVTPVTAALQRQRHSPLAAPTARRQLSTMTSSKAAVPGPKPNSKRWSGLVVAPDAVVGGRRLGVAKPAPTSRSTVSSIPKHSPTGTTRLMAPAPMKPVASTSRLAMPAPRPVPTTFSSKVARPVVAKLPTTFKRPTPGVTAPPKPALPLASSTSTVAKPISRPNSAASTSSASSNSLPVRPRFGTSMSTSALLGTAQVLSKPPLGRSTSALPLARPVPASRLGHGRTPAISAGPARTSALSASMVLPRLGNLPLSRSMPPSTVRPPSTAPVSTAPKSRALPPLGQTQSAPSLLAPSDSRPVPPSVVESSSSTASIPLFRPQPCPPATVAHPLPTLPRPFVDLSNANRDPKSPEKRRAMRTGEKPRIEIAAVAIPLVTISEGPTRPLGFRSASSQALSSMVAPLPMLARSMSTSSLSMIASSSPVRPRSFAREPIVEAVAEEPLSILTAESVAIDVEVALEVFGAVQDTIEAGPKLGRPQRSRAKSIVAEGEEAANSRPSRRAAATTTPALARPTRKAAPVAAVEEPVEPTSSLTVPVTPRPVFNPVPALTQEELMHLTQRNTMKNKAHFNKLDVQTIQMDENRPPSPSSKVRKSLGAPSLAGAASSGDRGERARNRRSALRSSIDGTGVELLKSELEAERSSAPVELLLEHYRAAGDEGEFQSPLRPIAVKGKGKKKQSTKMSLGVQERKRVKWDRALVYEGPLESTRAEGEDFLEQSILKRIPLDSFGNSKVTTGGYAKPASVVIKRVIYLDDE